MQSVSRHIVSTLSSVFRSIGRSLSNEELCILASKGTISGQASQKEGDITRLHLS